MSRWKVVITDRHGKDVDVPCPDRTRAGAVAFEWDRIKASRSAHRHPVIGLDGIPLGLIAGRDVASVRVVETP